MFLTKSVPSALQIAEEPTSTPRGIKQRVEEWIVLPILWLLGHAFFLLSRKKYRVQGSWLPPGGMG